MGNSNTEVMMMVAVVVGCVLALVFVGVYFLNRSVDEGPR